jgi:starch-binding outer membrane protein, SusD/RagB family
MKTKYLAIITLLLAALFYPSCEGFLDEKIESNVAAEEFYLTEEGFNSLVVSVYPEWKEIFGRSEPWAFWCGTDIYTSGNHAEPVDLMEYTTLNPRTESIGDHYELCFKIISKANMALYYSEITDQSNPDIENSVGQMEFIRAYAYFLLVQDYGGVPRINEYISDAVTSFDRNTAEEIYAQIITDLTSAISKLPDVPYADAPGRPTVRAAQHLLALVYLTRGYEDFGTNDDFSKAAQFADQTIAGQALDIPFDELWDPWGDEFSAEILFSIQYSEEIAAPDPFGLGHNQSSSIGGGSYMGGKDVIGSIHKNQTAMPNRYCYGLFSDPDDIRREVTFMTEQYFAYTDFWTENPDRSTLEFFFEPPWFTRQDSIDYMAANPQLDTSLFTYKVWAPGPDSYVYDDPGGTPNDNLLIKKFDDPDQGNDATAGKRDIILMRLGETYLIAAEAYLQAGQASTGLERLNVVRNRAGATPATLAEFDIYYILEERARELLGEYKRWYDLKRTGKLEELATEHNIHVVPGCFDGYNGYKKYLRPIPQEALDLNQNKNFPQNPAYVP